MLSAPVGLHNAPTGKANARGRRVAPGDPRRQVWQQLCDGAANGIPFERRESVLQVEVEHDDGWSIVELERFLEGATELHQRVGAAWHCDAKLSHPEQQIDSYVANVVRSRVPMLLLDEVFEAKNEIADSVKEELEKCMSEYGFHILQALVTDISPDVKVKNSMNEINAAKRLRVAAYDKVEAEKVMEAIPGNKI